VRTGDPVRISLQASDWLSVRNPGRVDEKASDRKAFQIVVLAMKTMIAKLKFSKPRVERLSERFLKKESFSEKHGTTKWLSVEAAMHVSRTLERSSVIKCS
jgi:hypothetical protein